MALRSRYLKIESFAQLKSKLADGFKLIEREGKFWIIGPGQRWYVPSSFREKLLKEDPTLDPFYIVTNIDPQHPVPLPVPTPPPPQIPTLPIFPLPPEEYILHELPARVIESIAILEDLHHIENTQRHELAFAQAKGDVKFNDKPAGQTLRSLADITVDYLVACYHKYQTIDDEIKRLEVERFALYNQYGDLQQRCALYEQELIEEVLTITR